MAKYTGPVCKICRREGSPLMLKGTRCLSEKCAFKRKKYAPGLAHKKKTKVSDYCVHLREKQKIKKSYCLLEKQFKIIFEEASRMKGVTGAIMLSLLERRLDNVIYRLGFASSRKQARQLIQHKHVIVNGKLIDIPSYRMNEGAEVAIKADFNSNSFLEESIKLAKSINSKPEWLDVNYESKSGKVLRLPKREDILAAFNEQLVVELYSK
jgi:small subunit ribosomal protein S4